MIKQRVASKCTTILVCVCVLPATVTSRPHMVYCCQRLQQHTCCQMLNATVVNLSAAAVAAKASTAVARRVVCLVLWQTRTQYRTACGCCPGVHYAVTHTMLRLFVAHSRGTASHALACA